MRSRIAVIIPTYNHGQYIKNAINSVLLQTHPVDEVIVVDDGSEDDTEREVKRFHDQRVRYLKIPHQGLVVAQNHGIENTTCDVIAIQGADDMSFPDRIEKCMEFIRQGFEVVYHSIYVNAWNPELECVARVLVKAPQFDKKRLLKEQYIPGVPVFLRKVWQKKPFRIETQYAYDWMMYLDWAYSGFRFKAVYNGLYDYIRVQNSASITFEKNGSRAEAMKRIKEIMVNEYHAKYQD